LEDHLAQVKWRERAHGPRGSIAHRAFFSLVFTSRNRGHGCGTPLGWLPFPDLPLGGFGNAKPAGKGQPHAPIALGLMLAAAIRWHPEAVFSIRVMQVSGMHGLSYRYP